MRNDPVFRGVFIGQTRSKEGHVPSRLLLRIKRPLLSRLDFGTMSSTPVYAQYTTRIYACHMDGNHSQTGLHLAELLVLFPP